MKTSIKYACLVAGALTLAGPVAAQTVVTVGGYGELFAEKYKKAVIDRFNESQKEVRVEYYAIGSSAQILGNLRAQKSAPQLDLAVLDISVSKAGTDEGLFDKIDETVSKRVADLNPQARLEGAAGIGFTLDNVVMLYSKKQFATAPTSWSAMWDPALRNKVTVSAPPEILGLALSIVVDKMEGGTDFKASTAKGLAKLAELAPNVLTFDPKPDAYASILSNQASLGVGWNARAQYFADQPDSNLGVVLPKEGSIFQINTLNLVKNRPSGEAATKFLDYALSPEAQIAFAKEVAYAPTNMKAVVPEEIAKRTAAGAPERMIAVNALDLAAVRDRIVQEWRRSVISRK
jgi:putative spermidine/putrescine transport system substrate-binding protein